MDIWQPHTKMTKKLLISSQNPSVLLSFFSGHVHKLLSTLHCWYLWMFSAVLFWSGTRKIDSRLSYNKAQQKTLRMAAKGKYDDSTYTWLLVQTEGTWGSATCAEHAPAPVWAMCWKFCCAESWERWGRGKWGVLVHPTAPLQHGIEVGLTRGCPEQGREKQLCLVIQTLTVHHGIWPNT